MSVYTPNSARPVASGPIGMRRDIGGQILLSVVTLGFYGIYWAYTSHEDIRRHTDDGVGGVFGVLIWIFAGFVSLFLLPIEIQRMYEADGQQSPVRASTAFWILAFGIPWFVKCQRALNGYWASKGAPAGMIVDRALSTTDGAGRGRAWARIALVALATLAAILVLQALTSLTSLALLILAAAVLLVVAPVVSWFALTTRSAWKRVLSLVVALVAAAVLVAALVVFTLVQLGGLLVVLAAALAFRVAARRAVPGVARADIESSDRPPPARPWMLVNPWSGGGTAARVGLAAAAEHAGFAVHVLAPGDDPMALARRAVAEGADVLAVAGGDGTLAQVAAVAVEADRPFLCVPAGTRNHFARDLGLDRSDPLGALRAVRGPEVRIDAAFVGDRLFLNNVSLGAYADVVAEPRYRAHKLDTSRVVVRRLVRGEREPLGIRVRDAGGRVFEGVQVLQVSNNRYQLRRLGGRERLDAGFLQVSALLTAKGSALAGLAVRAATGRLDTASMWAQWDAPSLTVESPAPLLAGGVDGESVRLAPPLEFRVVPGALRVLVPSSVPPWVDAWRRQQAIPELWRLATAPRRAPICMHP